MGTNNAKQFEVHMFKEDIAMMVHLVRLHPAKETGGDLFGLWTENQEPVLHVVLGPAIGCSRTEVSFHQSIPYLQRVGKLLTEQYQLCHIGEWHSHHQLRLSEPSSGDSSTVIRNFPRGTCGFLLIIANILPSGQVTLSPYLYKERESTYETGEIKQLDGCSPFKTLPAIRTSVEIDEDKSTTVHEYRLRARAKSAPSRPVVENKGETKEENACYMFKEDMEMIQRRMPLGVHAENRIDGDLLGLWTNDNAPVLHVVLGPNNKKEPQPVSSNRQPMVTIQRRGCLVEGYPLENIGKYILCPKEQLKPTDEESSYMRREYLDGGVLVLAYRVDGDSVSVNPYLYNKGSVFYQSLQMIYLPRGNVFSQNINDRKGEDKEGSDSEKMDVYPPPASPNFEQHKRVNTFV